MKRAATLAFLAMVLSACSDPTVPSRETVSEAVGLQEAFALGCRDCEGPEQFGRVWNVAIAPDGRVFVVTQREPFLRVFGNGGESEFVLGREGEGPGEMKRPWWVFFDNDGSFLVVDSQLRRVTHFTSEGRVIKTFRPTSRLINNAGYDRLRRLMYLVTWMPVGGGPTVERWNYGAQETTAVLTDAGAFPRERDGTSPSAYFAFAVRPEGGFVVGDRWWSYTIQRYGMNGDLQDEFGRSIERRGRTEAELKAAGEAEERLRQRGLGSAEILEQKQHFDQWSFRYDDDGRLWVRSTRTPDSVTTFDVFEADGSFIGEVTIPLRVPRVATSFDVGAGLLAAVVLDELDNPVVRVWRILK